MQRRPTGPWSALAETGTGYPPEPHHLRRIIAQKRVRTNPLPVLRVHWLRRIGYAAKIFCAPRLAFPGRADPDLSTSNTPDNHRRNRYAPCCGAEPGPGTSRCRPVAETGTALRRLTGKRLRRNGYAPTLHCHHASPGAQGGLQKRRRNGYAGRKPSRILYTLGVSTSFC